MKVFEAGFHVYAGEDVVLVCTIGGAPAPDCAWLAAIFEANWVSEHWIGLNDKGEQYLRP